MATPSIAMIPSGYKDGKVYSVLPNSSDGDFTFSRGSAATRVNEQGLVENVQIISPELVSNGNFSQEGSEEIANGSFDTDTNWTLGIGFSINGGSATCDGTQGGNTFIKQQNGILGASIDFVVGKTYKVNFDIAVTSGQISNVEVGGSYDSNPITTSGNHTTYITAVSTNDRFTITANPDFIGSIDNVSVKEVAQNWDLGTGWSVDQANSKVIGDGTSFTYVTQSPILLQNKKIKLTFDISDYVSGTFRLLPTDRQDGLDERFSGNGSYEVVYTSTIDIFRFQQQAFNGSISNISVKEITDDTDLPRLDYSDGSCPSLLLEPQSTNLLTYSEDFSQWQSGGGTQTIVQNATISPEGVNNASSIQIDSGYVYRQVSGLTVSNGDKYTWSCYVSSISQKITFGGGTIAGTDVYSSEDVGNGWYRQKLTRTFISSGSVIQPMFVDSVSGTDLFYIWGAQLEEQSYATSYIPTNGSIATRLADASTGSGNASLINSTEGVLYAEIAALADDGTFRFLGLSDGSNNNRVVMLYYTSANKIRAIVSSGGTKYVDVNYQLTNILDFHKIAIKYSLNDFALWIDGVEVITDTILNAPIGLDRLDFLLSGANNFYGKTKAVAVWKEALTDAELIELTTI